MSYETEGEKMAQELNEALGIESNASHTQRLITILRLRAQAIKEQETLLELEEVTRQRDTAEQRLADVLTAHVDFISGAITQAQVLQKVTQDFQEEVGARFDFAALDAFDLALAQFREKRDSGQRFDLSDVEEEIDADETGLNEADFPVDSADELDEDLDPLGLERAERIAEEKVSAPLLERLQNRINDPETSAVLSLGTGVNVDEYLLTVSLDQPAWSAEQLARFRDAREQETDTTEHDEAEPQPVPFSEPKDITLAGDTRDWLVSMAEGGARDEG